MNDPFLYNTIAVTEEQVRALVEKYRVALVPEWEIDVSFTGVDSEVKVEVHRSEHYSGATIRFHKDWEKGWRDAQDIMPMCGDAVMTVELGIIHEMIHITLRDVDRAVGWISDRVHPDVIDLHQKAYTHAMEGAIERLARFVVRKNRIKTATCATCGGCVVV